MTEGFSAREVINIKHINNKTVVVLLIINIVSSSSFFFFAFQYVHCTLETICKTLY